MNWGRNGLICAQRWRDRARHVHARCGGGQRSVDVKTSSDRPRVLTECTPLRCSPVPPAHCPQMSASGPCPTTSGLDARDAGGTPPSHARDRSAPPRSSDRSASGTRRERMHAASSRGSVRTSRWFENGGSSSGCDRDARRPEMLRTSVVPVSHSTRCRDPSEPPGSRTATLSRRSYCPRC